MYELYDLDTIRRLLGDKDFRFKKSMGQNFLIDPSVCPAMAEYCAGRRVLEIGPGVGVLTAELAKRAEKVVSVELDRSLLPVLDKTLAEFGNVKVINGDVMRLDLGRLTDEEFGGGAFSVCANLPYNITSPVIMRLLEGGFPIDQLVLMVQKEAAERLTAPVGSREGGAITVAVSYRAEAEILFSVGRESFMPRPNVDSAVIKLTVRREPPVRVKSEKFFFKVVKAGFAQRRKTLVNSVSSTLGIPKEAVSAALTKTGLSPTVRAEELKMEEFAALADELFVE